MIQISAQFSRSGMSNSWTPWTAALPGFPVHHQLPELAHTRVHRKEILISNGKILGIWTTTHWNALGSSNPYHVKSRSLFLRISAKGDQPSESVPCSSCRLGQKDKKVLEPQTQKMVVSHWVSDYQDPEVIRMRINKKLKTLWCWRRLFRVPWTARRLNQSILKEISPEHFWKNWCWSWSSNSLATWCDWLVGKDPDAGKDWGQEEKGATEDEMVGWHHWLNGHEFERALGFGDGQGSLACCSPWGHKESHWVTELWSHLESRVDFWSPYAVGIKKIISVTLLPNMFKHHIQGN